MKKVFILFMLFLMSCYNAQTTVMTFNIRDSIEDDGINSWENRKSFVVDVINEGAPDLLGVQEAMHDQLDYLALHLQGYSHVELRSRNDIDVYDSLLFFKSSRYQLVDIKHTWMSDTPDVPYTTFMFFGFNPSRLMTCVTLYDSYVSKSLVFCNTHISGGDIADSSVKLIVKTLKDINIPVIVTGDFNSLPFINDWPASVPNSVRNDAYQLMVQSFLDAFKAVNPKNTDASGCGWDSICQLSGDYRIDWIMSRKFSATSGEIMIRRRNGRNVSDHWPVVVKFLY